MNVKLRTLVSCAKQIEGICGGKIYYYYATVKIFIFNLIYILNR